jgi:hypothetical protein
MPRVSLVLLLLPSLRAAPLRETVPFSRAWRFHLGPGLDDAGAGPGNNWQASFSPTAGPCADEYPDPHRISPSDCETACAYEPGCAAWRSTAFSGGRTCFHSRSAGGCTPSPNNASTTGGVRAAATPLQTAYAFAARAPPAGAAGWPLVDAPHDALASPLNNFSEAGGDERHGYRVRTVAWYRKSFVLPADWAGSHVFLRFDGAVTFLQVWLNGVYLAANAESYNAFTVRLDNVSAAAFGADNVVAVRADASFGSEHWYGGGGLTRAVWLVRTPPVAFVEDALFVPPELAAGDARARAQAEWENLGGAGATAAVRFDLFDADSGALLATNTSAAAALAPGAGTATAAVELALPPAVVRWPGAGGPPPRYIVAATLLAGAAAVATDAVNASVGWRSTAWTADQGFALNGATYKQRGFSHHNSFAGVGVAMPQRLDAFRVQAARALGANIHRMSHNPYSNGVYDLCDALGILIWDENRDFGPSYVHQMSGMVKRGRNHVATVTWSLGNEIELIQPSLSVGASMVAQARALDGTRPTTANSNGDDGLWAIIDVQGLSHANLAAFQAARAARPAQPLVLSECCSCSTQRLPRANIDNACMASQNKPGEEAWIAGSLGVWTLVDYFGEPPGPWPYVSSSFGQLDLAGGVKPHAYWYATNWREMKNDSARVPLAPAPVARVTDLLDQLTVADGAVTLHGIASSAAAELIVDGVSRGAQEMNGSSAAWSVPVPPPPRNASCSWPTPLVNVQCKGLTHEPKAGTDAECAAAACAAGAAVWQRSAPAGCWVGAASLPCPPPADGAAWAGGWRAAPAPVRNATLVARDASGAAVAAHTVLAPAAGGAAALALAVVAPAPASGTGAALYLDGDDVALVAVRAVDAAGALVSTAPVNVTWAVAAGPGRVAGIGAGDPTSHEQPNGAVVATFGGLAHAVIQVTVDAVSPARDRMRAIDVDGGARTQVLPEGAPCPTEAITVTATAPGLPPATIVIPVSCAPADAPLEAARAYHGTAAVEYIREFVG